MKSSPKTAIVLKPICNKYFFQLLDTPTLAMSNHNILIKTLLAPLMDTMLIRPMIFRIMDVLPMMVCLQ